MPHGNDYGSGVTVPMNGTLALLVVDSFLIGHQRGLTVNESNDEIDYSSKEKRHMRRGYGRYSTDVSMQHLYVPNASGYANLVAAARAGTTVEVVRQELGSVFETAHGIITGLSGDYPDQGEAVISVDIAIDDVWA